MADLNKIVKDLSSLSVFDAAELSKLLEEKWIANNFVLDKKILEKFLKD